MDRVIVLALFVFSFFAQAGTLQGSSMVGTLPGELIVDQGIAQYQIPLSLPTGRGGNTPEMSLLYSSQGGAGGVIGPGFSLSGLSSISRCGSTFSTDGVARSVTYDELDNFCLDGSRLLTVSGIKGRDGSVYRPEFDNFSKVTLHGDATEPESYFTVQTKSGDVFTYGFQNNNQSWLVTKITDTTGKNPLIYSYNENSQLTNIHYDIFDVVFNYSNYADALNNNVKTFHYKLNNQIYSGNTLLSQIDIKTAGILSNYYKIKRRGKKEGDVSSLSGQIITGIEYCDSGFNCLPETSFEWSESPRLSSQYDFLSESAKSASLKGLGADTKGPSKFWVDLDGNRELDLCVVKFYDRWIYGFSCLTNSKQEISFQIWAYKEGYWWTDINNDGKLNLCSQDENELRCSTFSLDGTVTDVLIPMTNWGQEKYRWWLDFNGDGRSDFCRRDVDDLRCSLNKDGASWEKDVVIKDLDWASIDNTFWTDIDGNGYPDLCNNRNGGFVCTRFNAGSVIPN